MLNSNLELRLSTTDHNGLVNIRLELWSLYEDKKPLLKNHQRIICRQEDLQPPLEKDIPWRLLDDFISFSPDLRYLRIGSRLFYQRNSRVSASFEGLREDQDNSDFCTGHLTSKGSYLISAQTKTLKSSEDIENVPIDSDELLLPTVFNEQCDGKVKGVNIAIHLEQSKLLQLYVCDHCRIASNDSYHCLICDYNVCISCSKNGDWCREREHALHHRNSHRPEADSHHAKTKTFGSFYEQRLII